MSLRLNPFHAEMHRRLDAAGAAILTRWEGHVWRFNAIAHPKPADVLSGQGAFTHGSRWNARGTFPVVYGSTDEAVAVAEAKASDAYYGLVTRKPRLFVCLRFRLTRVLDLSAIPTLRILGLRLRDIQTEDWRKLHDAGQESLTQSIGRAAAEFGAEAILCRSARVRGGLNLAWFPLRRGPGSEAEVCDAGLLAAVAPKTCPK